MVTRIQLKPWVGKTMEVQLTRLWGVTDQGIPTGLVEVKQPSPTDELEASGEVSDENNHLNDSFETTQCFLCL